MSRLWSRSGLRVLSIMVLLFGLVGGAYLSVDRKAQQRITSDRVNLAYQQRLEAERYAAGAPARTAFTAAQTAANQRAKSDASAAAKKAQSAESAAKKKRSSSTESTKTSITKTPSVGPIPKSCSTYSGNRAIGCTLLLQAGFGLDQMPCLDKMWTKESNWRTTAKNSSSGSYGIPQSLPANKMAAFGDDYLTNPVPQIKWGLSYIKNRYTSPCGAWTFWQGHNFY